MKFEVYNEEGGDLKVAFFCQETFGNILISHENVLKISTYNSLEVHLLELEEKYFRSNVRGDKNAQKLFLENKRSNDLYRYIHKYIKKNGIGICIFFGSGFLWSMKFLEKVKDYSYVACYFADDPEGSEETSRHYVRGFHYAFCGGIFFDDRKRIEEKYREWGAKKSMFIPLGACPVKYKELNDNLDKRDTDLIYVGGAYLNKIIRIFKLKKHFGERMHLYGRGWNYHGKNIFKIIISKVVKGFYHIPEVEEISTDNMVDLYRRAKVGFNMHLSYGPSNQRLYELPINGVMQICDCEDGLKEIYEIDKEIVTYKTINEAIEKIEYYLKNDNERMKIARAGYEKAKKKYLLEHSFGKIKEEILQDIKDNYPNYLKY